MHNLTFSFDIILTDKNPRLHWQPINNGVLKCFIKYPNYTLELTKSPNGSILEVHLSEEYVFDSYYNEYHDGILEITNSLLKMLLNQVVDNTMI